jgi:hypothetical protein
MELIMDNIKAQEELTKIGIGNVAFINGRLDGLKGSTSRTEKLISFGTTSLTIERLSGSEVIRYSDIDSITPPVSDTFILTHTY